MSRRWRVRLVAAAVLGAGVCALIYSLPSLIPPDQVGRVEDVEPEYRGSVRVRLRYADPPPTGPAHLQGDLREQARLGTGVMYIHVSTTGLVRPTIPHIGQRVRVWCHGGYLGSFPPQRYSVWLDVTGDE